MTPPISSSSESSDAGGSFARPAAYSPTPAQAESHADDMRLLRRYVDHGSQAAFSQLVAKHLPWVFAMCRRALRDKHLAEDASQAVFVLLARRAATLSDQTRVAGWLFNSTRFVLKDVKKSEGRFQRRQGVARDLARDRLFEGEAAPDQDRIDPRLQAALDEGLALIGERDRAALLMHFYEGLTLPQMAERLGISRDGAKKRVARALARLRQVLSKRCDSGVSAKPAKGGKRGTGLSIVALALLLRGRDAGAMPADLYAATIAAATVPGAAPLAVEQILYGVGHVLASASRKLWHAVLAGQAAVAITVGVAIFWPAAKTSPAIRTGNPAVAQLSSASSPSATTTQSAARSPSQSAAGSAANSRQAAGPEDFEPPYRSGADDPEPKSKPKTEEDSADTRPPTLLSNSVGSAPAPGASQPPGYLSGMTYAGIVPQPRPAFITPAPGPIIAGEFRSWSPAPAPTFSAPGRSASAERESRSPAASRVNSSASDPSSATPPTITLRNLPSPGQFVPPAPCDRTPPAFAGNTPSSPDRSGAKPNPRSPDFAINRPSELLPSPGSYSDNGGPIPPIYIVSANLAQSHAHITPPEEFDIDLRDDASPNQSHRIFVSHDFASGNFPQPHYVITAHPASIKHAIAGAFDMADADAPDCHPTDALAAAALQSIHATPASRRQMTRPPFFASDHSPRSAPQSRRARIAADRGILSPSDTDITPPVALADLPPAISFPPAPAELADGFVAALPEAWANRALASTPLTSSFEFTASPTPEPASLLGLSAIGFACLTRRRRG